MKTQKFSNLELIKESIEDFADHGFNFIILVEKNQEKKKIKLNSNLFIGKKILECQIDKSGVKIKFENIETPIILACEVELENPYFDFALLMDIPIDQKVWNSQPYTIPHLVDLEIKKQML